MSDDMPNARPSASPKSSANPPPDHSEPPEHPRHPAQKLGQRPTVARILRNAAVLAAAALVALIVALGVASVANGEQKTAAQPEPNAVFMQPLDGLDAEALATFRAGELVFRTSWIVFPTLQIPNWDAVRPPLMTGWGLGPTYIANACMACHVQAGSGKTVDQPGASVFQQLVRLSVPGSGPHGGPNPHPAYGDQLQVFDVISADRRHVREGEADVQVDWHTESVVLADGSVVELRRPALRVSGLAFGPLGPDVMTSLRNTPVIFGLGYLESVSEEDILALAKQQQAQGLNGRPNYVRDDVNDRISLGRFGWKANQPSIRQQVAAAFLGDMGITSPLYTKQNCPPVQADCRAMPPGDYRPELRAADFDAVSFWAQALEAPEPRQLARADVQQGARLFAEARCAQCHVPELTTAKHAPFPALANRRFRPYTDLLLHDMGDALADGRPDFRAGPRDWRTPPLWGIGLRRQVNGSSQLLHDGRARTVTEAILWHGGEAQAARDRFAGFSRAERDALVAFVNAI